MRHRAASGKYLINIIDRLHRIVVDICMIVNGRHASHTLVSMGRYLCD